MRNPIFEPTDTSSLARRLTETPAEFSTLTVEFRSSSLRGEMSGTRVAAGASGMSGRIVTDRGAWARAAVPAKTAANSPAMARWAISSINLVLRSRPKVGVSKDGHGRGRASGHPSRRRAAHGSSERVKESPEGVARPQNVEYSTPKWGSRESKFPPGDLCRNVILPRHPKFDSFSRSQDEVLIHYPI